MSKDVKNKTEPKVSAKMSSIMTKNVNSLELFLRRNMHL